MRLPFHLLAFAATALLSPFADASSSTRNPLGALSPLQNATIHTKNHRVTALSEFHLSFNIRDDLHVKFHLEPNHDILASEASVSYLAPDGSVSRTERAERLDYKVFKGSAWVRRPRTGDVEWERVGWARAIVKKDGDEPLFEGAFAVHKDHHHIQSSTNYLRTRHRLDPAIEELDERGERYMVLWRDSDILAEPRDVVHQDLRRDVDDGMGIPSCGADGLSFNFQPDHPVLAGLPKMKRDYGFMDFSRVFKRQIDSTTGGSSAGINLVQNIGSTQGCPSTRKVALVGVATDCTYTADFSSPQDARENIIDQMNRASAIWEDTFHISLGLQNITLSDSECPGTPNSATEWNQDCSGSVDIQNRLNMFSAWRGTQQDDNSHWTLLSTCNTGSAVGLAWLGQACVQNSITTNNSFTGNGDTGSGEETVAGANVVIRTAGASEWQVIAHETGHTYGAVHDCTSQACANADFVNAQQCCPLSANTCDAGERYIMNPSTSQGITDFSPCSVGNICSAIGRRSVNTDCLQDNRNVETITGQQCGNGIVEPGEDCDCGGEEGCTDDPCCDASTCKFAAGAVCDDTNEDCCSNCQFASAGTVCRASTGVCDPQETCPGDSGDCPRDQTKPDGEDCGDGLQCTSGQCTSRDMQCKSAMGSYTQGNDTHSCDSQGCVISCASPEFGPNVCYGLQQNFLDGTECGGGGHCENGVCRGSTAGGQIRSWIDDHRNIVIGVCAAIGVLLLIAVLGCIRSCIRRRRAPPAKNRPPPPPPGGWQGWNRGPGGGGGVPPPPMRGGYGQQAGGWGGPSTQMSGARGGGAGGWATPPPPPPAYTRTGSVRYA